jgi:hypothetical protein
MEPKTLRAILGLLIMAQLRTAEGDFKNGMNYMRCITDILVEELDVTMSVSQVERLREEAQELLKDRKATRGGR